MTELVDEDVYAALVCCHVADVECDDNHLEPDVGECGAGVAVTKGATQREPVEIVVRIVVDIAVEIPFGAVAGDREHDQAECVVPRPHGL